MGKLYFSQLLSHNKQARHIKPGVKHSCFLCLKLSEMNGNE